MSSRRLTAAVVAVTAALVGGGLYLGLGGNSSDSDAVLLDPVATRPTPTVAPPATAAVITVAPATTVLLVSSDADGLFPVPNVVGQSQQVALSRLAAFEVIVDEVVSTNVNEFDEITSQSAAPGERLAPGSVVELVFSERPRPETVAADPLEPGSFDTVEPAAVLDGECGRQVIEERQLIYEPVDCSEPHDLQVLQRLLLENGPEEFDIPAIDSLLRRQCEPFFEEFVGVKVNDSDALRLSTIRPNPERYATEGERDSMCVIVPLSGLRIIGSAQDTLW